MGKVAEVSGEINMRQLKMPACLTLLATVSLLFFSVGFVGSVSHVTIRTRAENNRNASV